MNTTHFKSYTLFVMWMLSICSVSASLPAGWYATEVDSSGGMASYSSGTFTLNGTGNDPHGDTSRFFLYQERSDDFTLEARITSITPDSSGESGFAGLWLTTTLSPDFSVLTSFSSPGWIAMDVDGRPWVVEEDNTPRIVKLHPGSGAEIKSISEPDWLPVAIAIDDDPTGPLSRRLLIADNGPDQQVKIYDIMPSTPDKVGTIGVQGGMFAVGGENQDDAFAGLGGIGSDVNGNIYIYMDGIPNTLIQHDGGAFSTLRSFNDSGQLNWSMMCGSGEQQATWSAADNCWLSCDEWFDANRQFLAFSYNPFLYPHDRFFDWSCTEIRWINGKRFMFVIEGHLDVIAVFRFDGYTRVPCAVWSQEHEDSWPPNKPNSSDCWTWTDGLNGSSLDGSFQSAEFTDCSSDEIIGKAIHYDIDQNGNIWIISQSQLQKITCTFTNDDMPVFSPEQPESKPSYLTKLYGMAYDESTDTMYLGGTTSSYPKSDSSGLYDQNRVLTRYDNWNSNPSLTWETVLPWSDNDRNPNRGGGDVDIKPNIVTVKEAGDYIFAGSYTPTAVHVYSKSNGERVMNGSDYLTLMPGPELYGMSTDMDYAASVMTVDLQDDGEYIVSIRDDMYGKTMILRWTPAAIAQTPYSGSAATIPGKIEAENYDTDGEGIAYHDTTGGNEGGDYRSDSVDIQNCSDTDGGYNVGWIQSGEYLEYTVDVEPGKYTVRARMASRYDNRTVRILIGDGTTFTELCEIDCPNESSDWQDWKTAELTGVIIPEEQSGEGRVLRVEMLDSSFNVNWFEFVLDHPLSMNLQNL